MGKISAPPSKSMAHRLLIAAAMAEGASVIRGVSDCDDVLATLDCLAALGVKFEKLADGYRVFGIDFTKAKPHGELFCRESGSTLRMLIPAATLSGKEVSFRAIAGLMKRPMTVYEDIYKKLGFAFLSENGGYKVLGAIPSGEYEVEGNISSQFISGLIFALAARKEPSIIKITPPVESRSYIEMTLQALEYFSSRVEFTDSNTLKVFGGGYKPANLTVEGDWSGAAFPDALNLFGGKANILGLSEKSLQGDRVYKRHFKALSEGFSKIDITDCPDLAPILFAVAAAFHGAEFIGTKRLKIKESDRASAMASELLKVGCEVELYENRAIVGKWNKKAPLTPISSHGDHRIVMAMAILLTVVGGEIEGAEATAKSYPSFFEDLKKLNIKLDIYD